ncbi:hypothetical protein ACJX0J_034841, partial [Zea mays]
ITGYLTMHNVFLHEQSLQIHSGFTIEMDEDNCFHAIFTTFLFSHLQSLNLSVYATQGPNPSFSDLDDNIEQVYGLLVHFIVCYEVIDNFSWKFIFVDEKNPEIWKVINVSVTLIA